MSLARLSLRSLRASTPSTLRSISTTPARLMADDPNSNATRSGGQGDAFSKREQASEDYYVRQEEKKKLEALKKKIADSEAQLAKDRKDVEEMQKKGGQ